MCCINSVLQFNNEITKHWHHKTAKICFLKIEGNSSNVLKILTKYQPTASIVLKAITQ